MPRGEGIEAEHPEVEPGLLTLDLEGEGDTAGVFDTDDIVEAAEQMLRESAPHDFQVLIIGGGPGGYAAALRAAELGAKVGLIEEHGIGGAYLDDFVPARTLLEAAHRARQGAPLPNIKALRTQIDRQVELLREEMTEALTAAGVTIIPGRARFVADHCVEILSDSQQRRIKAVHVIIATGSQPASEKFPGGNEAVSRAELLTLKSIPPRVVVLGAGASGTETAYLYRTLGSNVTLLADGGRVLPQFDAEISKEMGEVLKKQGIVLHTSTRLQEVRRAPNGLILKVVSGRKSHEIETDAFVLAQDYIVDTAGLGLDTIGVEVKDGRILVDEDSQTNLSGVYAVGGCVHGLSEPQAARTQGRQVAEQVCGYPIPQKSLSVPLCCFTFPAAAGVGLTEAGAKREGRHVRLGLRRFRRFCGEEIDCLVKIVVDVESRQLIGCHVLAPEAGEVINVAAAAIEGRHTIDEMSALGYTECSLGPELAAAIRVAR